VADCKEYSEPARGELSAVSAPKGLAQKYRDANAAGKFLRYFLDKKEAQKWIGAADAR
jgi:hypothetical protein